MLIPKILDNRAKLLIAVAFSIWLTLLACSVSVKDHDGDGKSKVDISTPIGGLHVDENADAHDTGLPIYPGARPKPKSHDGDEKSANVNLSAFGYGLKVVALEYQSDDPPGKVIAFYQDQLKRYGNVVQCHTTKSDDYDVDFGHDSHASQEVKCKNNDNNGNHVELKSGTNDNQHIVSVQPDGKGSDFAIAWVRVRGKEGDI
jgi:hypothetical protein